MRQVQLSNDVLRPRRVVPLARTAFQVLRAHEVPAIDVQHTTDGPVEPSVGQLVPTVGTREPVGPHPVGRPQEEPALVEVVDRGGLCVEEPGSWGEPPQAQLTGEDRLVAREAGEKSLAHPVLLFLRQRLPPALGQQLQRQSNHISRLNSSRQYGQLQTILRTCQHFYLCTGGQRWGAGPYRSIARGSRQGGSSQGD